MSMKADVAEGLRLLALFELTEVSPFPPPCSEAGRDIRQWCDCTLLKRYRRGHITCNPRVYSSLDFTNRWPLERRDMAHSHLCWVDIFMWLPTNRLRRHWALPQPYGEKMPNEANCFSSCANAGPAVGCFVSLSIAEATQNRENNDANTAHEGTTGDQRKRPPILPNLRPRSLHPQPCCRRT